MLSYFDHINDCELKTPISAIRTFDDISQIVSLLTRLLKCSILTHCNEFLNRPVITRERREDSKETTFD